jgi:dihydropteroate synthase
MQDKPFYIDVVQEVGDYLIEGAQRLEKAGILPQRIILDPGFGFGKTKEHNLELFLHMDLLVKRIHAAGYRVLVGVSRKSFIGAVFGIEDPKDRDEASAQLAAALLAAGVDIVRVHNVAMTGAAIDDLSAVDSKSAYLALGSNLGATMSNLARALHLVDRLPLTNLEEIATPVLSEPAYDSNQSPFVNTVCRLKTNLAARALFTYLQAIELEMGREKLRVNGPRVIDLDLLSYDEESIDLPGLKLPHPRMSERAFVLEPLQELCPEGFVLPDGTKLEAAAEVYGQITTRLPLELLRSEIQQRREKESRRVKREESQQQIQVKAEDWSSWKGSL